ncbi:hypothetical protein SPRG_08205 [Saprolegnia parasitica CBS 223.65]|uniref:RRM domain-containing protein n=1 Tax=Saprolegnia parasitica (strain CBS 223.65) TaxID=695850 RepID=A0A067CHW1_SAPPC|nr:hypothetical protein SPRG_08205 [Saprolegnia parasitica CBS 223.65]KDO26402.1 hypothetical protein SPRG_08205 [Saprolegnia parasitica CBS 223.65]|eukprot:XP_012202840.1 hypothetical protein SPRG_08205 [Saprolegnia parasitica CBS 223.65]
MERLLDREFMRIECALEKNFEYLDKLDRQRDEALLREYERSLEPPPATDAAKPKKKAAPKNTSMYVMGLTTYIACKQLESICARLGRVKRLQGRPRWAQGRRTGHVCDPRDAGNRDRQAQQCRDQAWRSHHCKGSRVQQKDETDAPSIAPLEPPPMAEGADAVTAFLNEMQQRLSGPVAAAPDAHVVAAADPPAVAAPVITTADGAPELCHHDEHVLETPSRSILLYNIVDDGDADDESLDLEDDLQMECSNYGKVTRLQIFRDKNVVAVEFEALPSAIKCLEVMNGRWFGGAQIRACYDPSRPEEPEDEDTKLLAFLASV